MYRYAEFVEKYFGVTTGNQENIKLRCLFHDDSDPSMSFHLDKGVYKCFSCSAHGGILNIAKELGLTIVNHDYIEELDDPDAEWTAFARSLAEREDAEDTDTYLSEKRLQPYLAARNRYRVWARRGVTRKTVDEFQLGYDVLNNHLTIPCRHSWNNKLVGITRRQLNLGAKPKYLDAKGFRKRQSIFGTWVNDDSPLRDSPDRWVLTEGPIDAIKVWQAGYNGRAIMGGELTRDQVQLMLKLGVENVVLFFDDDKPGFKKAASAMGRLQRKFQLKAANYGTMRPSDPGDMNTQQIRWAITHAIELNDPVLI